MQSWPMQSWPVISSEARRARARGRWVAAAICAVAIAVSAPRTGQTQVPQVPSRYTTGREILLLDFAKTAVGDFPSGLKTLNGTMDVVEKGGMHMLRASSESQVLVQLPQVLPDDVTVELDIVPKECCAPDDIAIEGTDMDHRGPGSAQITWQTPRISVVGGAPDMYQAPMPDVLQNSTPGMLTRIVLVIQNQTIQLFTNGRRLFTLTDRRFVRRNFLWLMLGGADDGAHAVYLARLRVVDNAVITPAAGTCPPGSSTCASKTGSPPASPQTPGTTPPQQQSSPPPSSPPPTSLQRTSNAPSTNTPITTVKGSSTKAAGPAETYAQLGQAPSGGGTVSIT
jgi:hypothetical protein